MESAKRGTARREAIIRAALEQFSARGISVTSMADIARAARASKETIYRFFGDKRGLILAVIDRIADRVETTLPLPRNGRLDPHDHVEDCLVEVGLACMAVATAPEYIAGYRTVVAETTLHPEIGRLFVERVMNRIIDDIAALLDAFCKRGDIEIDNPHLAASLFLGLIQGRLHTRLILAEEIPDLDRQLREVVETGTRYFLDGVRKRKRRK